MSHLEGQYDGASRAEAEAAYYQGRDAGAEAERARIREWAEEQIKENVPDGVPYEDDYQHGVTDIMNDLIVFLLKGEE